MKICNSCNTHLHDLYVTCPNCGNTQLVYVQDNYSQQPSMIQQPNMMYNQQMYSEKNNKFAVASVICLVVGFFLFWTASFLGIIFGILALVQISKTHEKGKTLALVSIIINVLLLLLLFHHYNII